MKPNPQISRLRAVALQWRAWLPWILGLAASAVTAAVTLDPLLTRTGGQLILPLDDSYIHLQYARSFAELTPFHYHPQAQASAGTTSILWPLLLSPFLRLGLEPLALGWIAVVLGFVCLGLLSAQSGVALRGLVRPSLQFAGAALVLALSAHAWFAASGMEVLLLAWLLMLTVTLCANWWETEQSERHLPWLLVLAWLLPLARPEGALGSVAIATTLALKPRRDRRWALLALVAVLGPALIHLLFSGQSATNTAMAKWLIFNPYYQAEPSRLFRTVFEHVRLLFSTLMNGEGWSPMFLPRGYAWLGWLSPAALLFTGVKNDRRARAVLLVWMASGILIPCSYETFLVNRLRYLWPFAAAWLAGLVALAELLAVAFEHLSPESRRRRMYGTALAQGVCLVFAIGLGSKYPSATADLAESADAIRRQQVALGLWARDALPAGARLGVNDTGAIAYLSEHQTFDVVGLTSAGEAEHWVHGPGSRFEHYERLGAERLPSHFIVYPEWFGIDPLLGPLLQERIVHATILGGNRMAAYRADYTALDSAERPAGFESTAPLDRLDVADVVSERAHGYELLSSSRRFNRVFVGPLAVDGGRGQRTREHFSLNLAPRGLLVLRVAVERELSIHLVVTAADGARFETDLGLSPSQPWQEAHVLLPRAISGPADITLSSAADSPFAALHYWSFESPPEQSLL